MNRPKRQRSQWWSTAEKELLIDCVREKIQLIESKSSELQIVKEKRTAWNDIAETFAQHGFFRTRLRIKEQWRRMKYMAKINVGRYEREHEKNDGEALKNIPEPSIIDITVRDMCFDEFLPEPARRNRYVKIKKDDSMEKTSKPESISNNDSSDDTDLEQDCDPLEQEDDPLNPDNDEAVERDSDPLEQAIEIVCNPLKRNRDPSEKNRNTSKRRRRVLEDDAVDSLAIDDEKSVLELRQMREIHEEVMQQMAIERERKQLELEIAKIRKEKEEIELRVLKNKWNF